MYLKLSVPSSGDDTFELRFCYQNKNLNDDFTDEISKIWMSIAEEELDPGLKSMKTKSKMLEKSIQNDPEKIIQKKRPW